MNRFIECNLVNNPIVKMMSEFIKSSGLEGMVSDLVPNQLKMSMIECAIKVNRIARKV